MICLRLLCPGGLRLQEVSDRLRLEDLVAVDCCHKWFYTYYLQMKIHINIYLFFGTRTREAQARILGS